MKERLMAELKGVSLSKTQISIFFNVEPTRTNRSTFLIGAYEVPERLLDACKRGGVRQFGLPNECLVERNGIEIILAWSNIRISIPPDIIEKIVVVGEVALEK